MAQMVPTYTPENLQKSLLSWQSGPIIFKDKIRNWPAASWTPETLANTLGTKQVEFRVGEKDREDVQWETGCKYITATVQDFLNWQKQAADSSTDDNPFHDHDPDTHWAYMDYKYMSQIFEDQPEQLKAVDWSVFGFEGRDGAESTLWLGSPGAYTVCHSDTYGCNLVAQLYGRKRWVLFPPQQADCLYPTRLPYEESSIFSQVNIPGPDLETYPKFKVDAYVVTLLPGDVLFVPRHWWHFVEHLETSVSVNTWIDMEGADDVARLHEAITRTVVCSMMSESDSETQHSWLNPTETLTGLDTNLAYITQSLIALGEKQYQPKMAKSSAVEVDPEASLLAPCSFTDFLKTMQDSRTQPTDSKTDSCAFTKDGKDLGLRQTHFEPTVKHSEGKTTSEIGETIPRDTDKTSEAVENAELTAVSMTDLVDCIAHPDIVSLIGEKLLKRMNTRLKQDGTK